MRYSMTKAAGRTQRFMGSQARERAQVVETARRSIPVNTYLNQINHMILTGEWPDVDPLTGLFSGKTETCSRDERIEGAKWMIGMAMPQLQRVTPEQDDGMKDAALSAQTNPDDIAALSTDMIRALIAAAETKPAPAPTP